MIFRQLNPQACRTYLIGSKNDPRVIIVDPVIDHFSDYLALLKGEGLSLTHVIDTHSHADHISAGSALRDATGCEYVMHAAAPPQCVSARVQDGDILRCNTLEITVLHTPGHTPDSISLLIGDKLLTGDFLFLDDAGAGRDDLPGGSPGDHWESLNKLRALPAELVVYPAHEYRNRQPSTLGRQRQSNPHLQQRSKEEFIKYLDDLQPDPADWMRDVLTANYACAQDPQAAWIPVDTPACALRGTMAAGVNEIKVRYIEAQEVSRWLQTDTTDVVLIDVREKEELTGPLGQLAGILHIPIGRLAGSLAGLQAHKFKKIVVVCRSDARATTGAQILTKAGFDRVYVLKGGMLAWKQQTASGRL
ncbi:MBL fold metallo-hydrolase [Sporomusa termitida]|uniref:Hydroxyacylglutathione hydrolase n=1 Tax=Sporomusa termitida TaxID=2377 RepID=A0A517DY26_9FIRM|nr:MBL fold metallo-hydrolase [Sporomusa termitida]QDR82243.1 Hydroxyacylglutathione hydrolase [Sporomusa termitida]